MQGQISSTLQILLARFNGQVLIPFALGSESLGIPAQTARNKLSDGTYPIRTVMYGSRRFIYIEDMAEFVESLRVESKKHRLGRPVKVGPK